MGGGARPRGGDELNLIEKGKNYGWPVIVHGINYPGTKIGDAIVEKAGLEQPRYYWDPVIAPSALAFYKGDLFPQWKSSALIGALAGQALFRVELGKDDKVVNEEPLLMDLGSRLRDVQVFSDGAVHPHRGRQRAAAEGDAEGGGQPVRRRARIDAARRRHGHRRRARRQVGGRRRGCASAVHEQRCSARGCAARARCAG
ncbi:MAG: PQQ-dependent sugar dehydrogenase [Vicinamibacterales bacterium]